jgi:aspartyl-tRNA(Asn)/glutamyl-tRNA(Gln) amidotransferase subunit C
MRPFVSIDRKQVLHIAGLANLAFSEEEYDRITDQLNEILGWVEQLNRLDTSSVEPTAQVLDSQRSLREDRVGGSIANDEALANAPESDAGLFKVPRVIG